jgi:hypothetical protein
VLSWALLFLRALSLGWTDLSFYKMSNLVRFYISRSYIEPFCGPLASKVVLLLIFVSFFKYLIVNAPLISMNLWTDLSGV